MLVASCLIEVMEGSIRDSECLCMGRVALRTLCGEVERGTSFLIPVTIGFRGVYVQYIPGIVVDAQTYKVKKISGFRTLKRFIGLILQSGLPPCLEWLERWEAGLLETCFSFLSLLSFSRGSGCIGVVDDWQYGKNRDITGSNGGCPIALALSVFACTLLQ